MASDDTATEDNAPVTPPQPKGARPKTKKPEPKKRELKSKKRVAPLSPMKKKRRRRKRIAIGVIIGIAFITSLFFLPRFGTVKYGICKTYVELHDPYPQFLEFVAAEEYVGLVILDYNKTDAFGQRTLNRIRCTFNTKDPNYSAQLTGVDVNGRLYKAPMEDPAEIKKFDPGIPSLLVNKPGLILPKGLPEDIKDYK